MSGKDKGGELTQNLHMSAKAKADRDIKVNPHPIPPPFERGRGIYKERLE
jgi:hypothetical protein